MSDLAISMKGAGALPTTKSSESVINTPPGPAMLGVGTEKPAQSARTWRQFIGCALTIAGALTMVFGGASIAGAVVGGILLCIGLTITGFEVITGDDSEGLNENQPQPTVVDTNEL